MIGALRAPSSAPTARRRGHRAAAVGWVALAAGVALQHSVVVGFVVLAGIFVPLERAFPLCRQRRLRAQVWSDLVHLAVNRPVGNVAVLVAVAAVGIPLRAVLVPGALRLDVAAQPEWLQVVEAVVVGEVGGYWGHRAAHRVPLLWRFHRVHHSIVEMDFLAAGRTHPLDAIAMRGPAILPLGNGVTAARRGRSGARHSPPESALNASAIWSSAAQRAESRSSEPSAMVFSWSW